MHTTTKEMDIEQAKAKGLDLYEKGEMTIKEIMHALGRTRSVWYHWKRRDEEFKEGVEERTEIRYERRLKSAEKGQKKMLEGYEYQEVEEHYDKNGNVTGKTVRTKHKSPHASVIIHALKNLDEKYNQPDRIDHTTEGESLNDPPDKVIITCNKPKSLEEE